MTEIGEPVNDCVHECYISVVIFAALRILSDEIVFTFLKSDNDDIVTDSTNASIFFVSDVSDEDWAVSKVWMNACFAVIWLRDITSLPFTTYPGNVGS